MLHIKDSFLNFTCYVNSCRDSVMCSCHLGHKWLELEPKRLRLFCTSSWQEEVLENCFNFSLKCETWSATLGGNSLSFVHRQMYGSTGDGDIKPNSSRNLFQPVAPPPFGSSFVASKLVPVGMGSSGGCLRSHYAAKMKRGRGGDWIRKRCRDERERCQFSLYSCLALDDTRFSLSPFSSGTFSFLPVQVSIGGGGKWVIYVPRSVCPPLRPVFLSQCSAGGHVKTSLLIVF